jgi:hypothetical protein
VSLSRLGSAFRIPVLLTLLFVAPFSFAQKGASEHKATKKIMGGLLEEMEALKPYFLSEEKFADAKNQKEISSHLSKLGELGRTAKHDPVLNQENYKVSAQVLSNHLNELERVFNKGNKSYARWMLTSTLSVCMSCHAQFPTVSRELKAYEKGQKYAGDFEQAEFLFATRAFDEASKMFDKLIRNYPASDKKNQHLEVALQRQVAYFSRLKRDPKTALKTFTAYAGNKEIPEYLQNDIKAWVQQFGDWSRQPTPNPKKMSQKEIMSLSQRTLDMKNPVRNLPSDSPKLVAYLKVSGMLYEYLNSHPKSNITPEILYYLSVYDRSINNNFFYSLANLYLRDCILNYSDKPIAQKCYDDFESETVLSYSGSEGTSIPKEVRDDLKNLKGMLGKEPAAPARKD